MIRIDGYLVDLAISEDHSFPGEVTDYPVEQGPDISDHIRNLPEEITLECVVSDTPIGEAAADPSRQAVGAEAPLPSTEALAKLREIRAARRPVTVETTLGTFESMALVDLTVPKSRTTDGGLFFTVKFRRIEIVTNRRTRRRVATPLAGAGGTSTKATVGKPIVIDDTIEWRKGVPPGAPWKPGNVIEQVDVQYRRNDGGARGGTTTTLSSGQLAGLLKVSPGSSYIRYFKHGTKTQIVGEERAWLVADLQRDINARRARQTRDLQKGLREDPEGTMRKMRNLPPGVDPGRFQRVPEPTFPTTAPPPTPTTPKGAIR